MNPLLFSIIFVMTHTSMNTAPLDRQGNKNSSKRPSILSSITATFPKNNFKSYCPLPVFCEHSSVYHKTNWKTQHLENTGISIVTHDSVFPCRKKPKYKKKILKLNTAILMLDDDNAGCIEKKVNTKVPWKILFWSLQGT